MVAEGRTVRSGEDVGEVGDGFSGVGLRRVHYLLLLTISIIKSYNI